MVIYTISLYGANYFRPGDGWDFIVGFDFPAGSNSEAEKYAFDLMRLLRLGNMTWPTKKFSGPPTFRLTLSRPVSDEAQPLSDETIGIYESYPEGTGYIK